MTDPAQPARSVPLLTGLRQRPIEVSVLVVSLALGFASLTGLGRSDTAAAATLAAPTWVALTWLAMLIGSAGTSLAALFIGDPIRSATLERVGLWPLGLLLASYAVSGVVVVAYGGRLTLGPLLWGVLGAGVVARAVFLGRDLERVREVLRRIDRGPDGEGRTR